MSKRRRKEYIEGPSLHGQRTARRTAAMNKTRPRAVARTTQNPVLTETSGEMFASGAMIELVRNSDADQIKLAHWDGSSISICTRVDLDGRTFVPPALHDSVLEIINLPSNATDYGSTSHFLTIFGVYSASILRCRRKAFRKSLFVRWRLGSQNPRHRLFSCRLPMLRDLGC